MRRFFTHALFLTLMAGFLFPCLAFAADAKTAIAQALAEWKAAHQPYLTCKCGTACPCGEGECADPGCPSTFTVPKVLPFTEAHSLALAEGRPIIIWVGQGPPVGRGWARFVNTRYDGYPNTPSPGLVAGKPVDGELQVCGRFRGLPALSDVQARIATCALASPPPPAGVYGMSFPIFLGGGGLSGCAGGRCH